MLPKIVLSSVEKKRELEDKDPQLPPRSPCGPEPAGTIQSPLSLRLFYFILIFNVKSRETGEVGEEELLGSPEDSMGCHLNRLSISHS